MIDIVEKKVPHSFRNKYLRNSGSVSLSTTTPMPSSVGGAGVDVLKVDDGRLSSDDNVFSSLRALLEIKSRIIAISDNDTELSDDNTLSSLRTLKEIISRIVKSDDANTELTDENVLSSLRASDQLKAAVDELNASIKSLEDVYLFKTKDDKTAGHLTIEGGTTTDLLQSSQFTSGTLGAGYLIKYDPVSGKSYIEVDEMYVRLKAVFDSLVIKESQHVGGQQIYSCASIECTKVEYIYREALFDSDHKRLRDSDGKYLFALLPSPVYRCYFTSTDGSKTILNQFVPGDLAQCRQFDIKDGTTGHAKNRYYWRHVVSVGDNYIDLAVNDCEEGSDIPEAGDKIIQLGNRTDVSRQNAIIMSAYGDNAPSKQMLQGINSYSLVDRVVLEEGFDRVTNQAYTKTFGRSYIGARDESTYMRFTPDKGVEIKGNMTLTEGSTVSWNSISESPSWIDEWTNAGTTIGDKFIVSPTGFFGKKDPVTGKLTGIMQGNDLLINGVKRTGIFALVDNDVVFEIDPINKKYKFIGNIESDSIVMKDFAHLSSAIFSGNYILSQYGKDSFGADSVDYEKFNPQTPHDGNFTPNLLMNLLTGDFFCNNVKIDGVLQGTLKNKVIRYNAKSTDLIKIDLYEGTDYIFYISGTTVDSFVRLPHDKEYIGITLRISFEAYMGGGTIHITASNNQVFCYKRYKGSKIQLQAGGYLELVGVPSFGATTAENPSGIGNLCMWRIVNSADYERVSSSSDNTFRSVAS